MKDWKHRHQLRQQQAASARAVAAAPEPVRVDPATCRHVWQVDRAWAAGWRVSRRRWPTERMCCRLCGIVRRRPAAPPLTRKKGAQV